MDQKANTDTASVAVRPDVDEIAQEIRRVGAAALAEALHPFIDHHITQAVPKSSEAQSIRKTTLQEVLEKLRENPAECIDVVEAMLKDSENMAVDVQSNSADSGVNACVAVIQFVLETEQGMEFLQLWNAGEFEECRTWWPEAPDECYIGADPLHPKSNPSQEPVTT